MHRQLQQPRTWVVGLIWCAAVIGGSLLAGLGHERWEIAGGGALVGIGLMVLAWALMLHALCGSLRAVLRRSNASCTQSCAAGDACDVRVC
jgi:hypothetical protein